MNDKENEIYTNIHDAIIKVFPNASVTNVYLRVPPSFPHVSVIQSDTYEPKAYVDSSSTEKVTALTFQIDIYSDDDNRKKTICKLLSQIVDEKMKSMNFRRIMLNPIMNLADSTIYRITAIYTGMADNGNFYVS